MKNIFSPSGLPILVGGDLCANPWRRKRRPMAPRNFSSLVGSCRNFSRPRGGTSAPHTDAILLCQQAKRIGGAPGPAAFITEGNDMFIIEGNDMQSIRLTSATEVLASISTVLGFVPASSIVVLMLRESVSDDGCVDRPRGRQSRVPRRASGPCGEAGEGHIVIIVALAADEVALRVCATRSPTQESRWPANCTPRHSKPVPGGRTSTVSRPDRRPITASRISTWLMSRTCVPPTVAAKKSSTASPKPPKLPPRQRTRRSGSRATTSYASPSLELGAVIGARAVPTADLAARVGLCATVSASARNAQMAVFTQGERDADSFATIACQVRGSARVQDLTLTGYCAYLTNDGSTASIAFEAVMSTATAAGCTPAQTNLRRLLDGALHNGVPRPRSPRSSPRYTSTSRSPSASTSTTPRAERKREQPRLRIRSRGYSRTRWRLFGHRARTTAAPTPRATTMQRLAGKSVEQTAGRTGNREHDIHPFRGIGFDGLAGDDGREIRAGDHAQMLRCLIQRRLHRRSGGGAVDRR